MSDWLDNVRSVIQTPEVAGTAGGLLSLSRMPGSSWMNKITSLGAGLCLAVYVIPWAVSQIGVESIKAVLAFSFIGGFLGLLLLSRLWDYVATTPFGDMLSSVFTRKQQ